MIVLTRDSDGDSIVAALRAGDRAEMVALARDAGLGGPADGWGTLEA